MAVKLFIIMGNDSSDGSKAVTRNKLFASAVTVIGLMMFAMLTALIVVAIIFSIENEDLNSRYNQVQVETSTSTGSLEALIRQEILALRSEIDQVNSSVTSNVQAQANDIVAVRSEIDHINSSLISSVQAQANAVRSEIDRVNSSLTSNVQAQANDIVAVRCEIDQINSSLISSVQAQANAVRSEIDRVNSSLTSNVQAQANDIVAVRCEIDQINSSLISNVQAQANDVVTVRSEIDQVNSSLSMQVSSVQAQADGIVSGLEQTGMVAAFPGASCGTLNSFLSSGNYWLRTSTGDPVNVYCNMDLSCNNVTGWMRVADLDFSNRNDSCPSHFTEGTLSGVRFCEQTDGTGCSRTDFSTFDVPYSKVCGKVIGYQFGTTEAFSRSIVISSLSLNSQYLDGISLTRGNLMDHIWSFAAGVTTTRTDRFGCPCATGSTVSVMSSFVGSDYFCDSAAASITSGVFYSNALWDNVDCLVSGCCNFNSPPWFYKELSSSAGPIEFRACRDESGTTEGVYVGSLELYVQ